MKFIIYSLVAVVMVMPFHADAYFSTDQRIQKINETTALFFIDFAFGHESHPTFIPVIATRDQAFNSELTSLGFEVLEESKYVSTLGATQAIVLGSVSIEDGMYKVPAGKKASFTLAVIFTTKPDTAEVDYAVHVTDLPFYVGEEKEYRYLNPSELKYYITPEVELNSLNPSKYPIESIKVDVHTS